MNALAVDTRHNSVFLRGFAIFSLMAACLFAAVAGAADQTLTYTAADKPATLGTGGELVFTYDGDKVTRIVSNVAKGDTVYLKGDTLAFGADATIETAGLGDLVISNALSGTSGLLVTNTSSAQLTAEWWGDNLLDTNAWTTVFENVDLDDIELVSSDNSAWNAIHKVSGFSNPQLMYPYWVRTNTVNGVKTMTAQLQCWTVPKTGSPVVKYVGIELKQAGADIAARATTAGYIPTNSAFNATYVNTSVYRDDFEALRARWNADPDATVNPSFTEIPVKFPGFTSFGYGVGQLTARRRDVPSVSLNSSSRTLNIGGDLKIAANARARRLRTNSYNPASGDTSSVDVEGLWEMGDYIGSQGTPIKGGGTVGVVAETLPHANPCDATVKRAKDFIISTATNLDWNASGNLKLTHSVYDITNICNAIMCGKSMTLNQDKNPSYCIATPHHWRFYTNGPNSYVTVQMQASNGVNMIRCTILKFMQSTYNVNVVAITNMACYTPLEKDKYALGVAQGYYGMDFETETDTVGIIGYKRNTSTTSADPFSVSNLVCQFSRPGEYSMSLNAKNPNWKNGRLVVEGKPDGTRIFANVNGESRLPKDGIVEVRMGGTLNINSSTNGPSVSAQNNSVQIKVYRGGVLRTYPDVFKSKSGKWAYKKGQRIDLLGGEMMPTWLHYSDQANSFCYLNNTIFADGGRVTSDIMFWAGNSGSGEPGRWLVRGTSPSYVDSPVQFLGTGTTGWFEFKIDVADVAEGTDFFMTKPITRYSSTSLSNIRIGKFGQGTMEIQDTIDVIKGVYIYGGVFKLAGSHLTDASAQKFALSGGTLEAADGTANSCGPLAITARGGKIKLGEGATLNFADSSAETWPSGVKVTVEGFVEGAIRFGNSSAAVPRRNMFKLPDGTGLGVNDEGCLVPVGMVIIFR